MNFLHYRPSSLPVTKMCWHQLPRKNRFRHRHTSSLNQLFTVLRLHKFPRSHGHPLLLCFLFRCTERDSAGKRSNSIVRKLHVNTQNSFKMRTAEGRCSQSERSAWYKHSWWFHCQACGI